MKKATLSIFALLIALSSVNVFAEECPAGERWSEKHGQCFPENTSQGVRG